MRYLEQNKGKHFSQLDAFRKDIEGKLARQEEKLRKLSIEYDKELYPHLVSAVAERRYPLIFFVLLNVSNLQNLISSDILSYNCNDVLFPGG